MSKVFNKAFNIGILSGILFCAGINYYTVILFKRHTVIMSENEYTMGFPFYWYEYLLNLNRGRILWSGLIADILFAVAFSFLIGLTLKFVRSRISSQRTELK